MRRLDKLLAAVLAAAVAWFWAGCAGKPSGPVGPPVLAKAGLQYYWTLDLALEKGESLTELKRLDENLYCLTDRNKLVALDAATGLLKWSRTVAEPGATVFSPVHADHVVLSRKVGGIKEILDPGQAQFMPPFDAVLINTLSNVLLMDRRTGEAYRDIPLDFPANTSVACDGQNVYVGSTKGWYYSIRLNAAVKEWWLAANDMITAPVVYLSGRLYVADNSGSLLATDVGQGGKKLWTQKLAGAVTAEFHVDQRGCFVGSDGNRVYAFSLGDGKPLWDQPFVCQGPIRDPIQVAANSVFQYARQDKFYALNVVTGQQRWSLREGRKVLAAMDGEVYLLSQDGALLMVDEMLGNVRTSMPMTGWELFAANTTAPVICAASRDGKLACMCKLSAGRLTPESLRQH